MATAIAANRPSLTPSGPSVGPPVGPRFAIAPLPLARARIARAATPDTLAIVNTFWTKAPARSPRTLMAVTATITTSPAAWAVVKRKRPSANRTASSLMPGRNTPRYFAKATATAATKPVLMATRKVHP